MTLLPKYDIGALQRGITGFQKDIEAHNLAIIELKDRKSKYEKLLVIEELRDDVSE